MSESTAQKEVRELASEWGAIDLATVTDEKKYADIVRFAYVSRHAWGRRNKQDCIAALLLTYTDYPNAHTWRTMHYYSFDKDVIKTFLDRRYETLGTWL